MARLCNFDYKSPYFYMVTLKKQPGIAEFSKVGDDGRLVKSDITRAFESVIEGFHLKWRCIEPVSPYAIMPDHIHLMMKIKPTPDRVALGVIVSQLSKALRCEYWRIVAADAATRNTRPPLPAAGAQTPRVLRETPLPAAGAQTPRVLRGGASAPPPIFSPSWHDWIVKRDGQLAAFRRYIRENPARAALRRANARYFGAVRRVSFLGKEWFACGNLDILKMPVITSFKGHRATAEGSDAWNAAIAAALRIGPGGAGISTFMSPLEKACGNAIAKAGGRLIVLSPEGFGPRWHPTREKERFCAQGRMLFLSLYEAGTRQPTRKELYERCHEMVDLAVANLPGVEA